jgi:putative endonuclease
MLPAWPAPGAAGRPGADACSGGISGYGRGDDPGPLRRLAAPSGKRTIIYPEKPGRFWQAGCKLPGMDTHARVELGKSGEDLACQELTRLGYSVLARRYHTRVGEIDIVAREGPVVAFIEVKTRSSDRYGHPAEAVTFWKQRRIGQMARHYLMRFHLADVLCRFDVVCVWTRPGEAPRVELIRDAFRL